MTYTLRQEKFNNKFSFKDLLNKIQKIALSLFRNMSDIIGSLDYLSIYSFFFLNVKSFSLYNSYNWNEVENKLVIKIDQDDQALKFSITNDVLEVYSLLEIYECINNQKSLKAIININTIYDDMKANRIKFNSIFI